MTHFSISVLTVAIGATDFALRYLSLKALPASGISEERRDVKELVANVVELKHEHIDLTAIDARMR
jgi:hypothetical protein